MRRTTVVLLLLLAAAALASAAKRERDQLIVFEDERHYLLAASSLLREGRFTFADPDGGGGIERGDLMRDPGYSAALALAWKLSGASPPAGAAEINRLFDRQDLVNAIRALHLLLLGIAAGAAGLAVWRLEGDVAGALAAVLVAASPALHRHATIVYSESLSAAFLATLAAGLVLIATGRRHTGAAIVLATASLLPLVRAETVLLLPLAAIAVERAWGSRPRSWLVRFGLALVLVSLPSAIWMARNEFGSGHFVLSDRGGMAIAVRAALDADVARFGARVAALSFTPSQGARARARELEPEATFLDYRPAGSDNFVLRTYRQFIAERAQTGADPLEVDRRLGLRALDQIGMRFGAHLATAVVVAWRGLFAERSPDWAAPFDLTFALGLLLGTAFALVAARSLLAGHWRNLALVAPAAVLIAFHVAFTEFLPRYAVPLLPALWSALVIALAGFAREIAERRAARNEERAASRESGFESEAT